MARLAEVYRESLAKKLAQDLGIANPMAVPRLEKITLNMGVGEASRDKKLIEVAAEELTTIAGQKAQVRLSRLSVAGFKIRDGMPIGVRVTLRRERMYEFLDRFISVAAPRIRDFRGFPSGSFDGRGNYNFGLKDQTIFPEIEIDKVSVTRGMDIAVTTSAANDMHAKALLAAFGFPFRN